MGGVQAGRDGEESDWIPRTSGGEAKREENAVRKCCKGETE